MKPKLTIKQVYQFLKLNHLICFFVFLTLISCQQSKEDEILKNNEGIFKGYAIVGNAQGECTIQIKNGKATVQYSFIFNHSAEDVILGTGRKESIIESGTLSKIELSKSDNGVNTIYANWQNDDNSLGSGKLKLSLSETDKNTLECKIYNTLKGWEYFGTKKLSQTEFNKIIKDFCPDTSNYSKLFIKTLEVNSTSTNYPNFFEQKSEDELNNEVTKYINEFYSSLEQSKEENENAYNEGTPFKGTNWSKFLTKGVSYSEKRLTALTGEYHYNYNIKLQKIVGINKTDDKLIIKVNAEYFINGVGQFCNEEHFIFMKNGTQTSLKGWYDVKPALIEKVEEAAEADFDANELYRLLGSNKL